MSRFCILFKDFIQDINIVRLLIESYIFQQLTNYFFLFNRTCLISIILAVYLNGWNMPLPMYTRGRGCHIVRYPLQQVLAVRVKLSLLCLAMNYTAKNKNVTFKIWKPRLYKYLKKLLVFIATFSTNNKTVAVRFYC